MYEVCWKCFCGMLKEKELFQFLNSFICWHIRLFILSAGTRPIHVHTRTYSSVSPWQFGCDGVVDHLYGTVWPIDGWLFVGVMRASARATYAYKHFFFFSVRTKLFEYIRGKN